LFVKSKSKKNIHKKDQDLKMEDHETIIKVQKIKYLHQKLKVL